MSATVTTLDEAKDLEYLKRLDALIERIANLPGFTTSIKIDVVRRRLIEPEFLDFACPEPRYICVDQLEEQVTAAEAALIK